MFDIIHADALQFMKIQEDKRQRELGRPSSLIGVNKKLVDNEKRARFHAIKEENLLMKYRFAYIIFANIVSFFFGVVWTCTGRFIFQFQ